MSGLKTSSFQFYSSPASSNEINGMANAILLNEHTELLLHQEQRRRFLAAAVPKELPERSIQ